MQRFARNPKSARFQISRFEIFSLRRIGLNTSLRISQSSLPLAAMEDCIKKNLNASKVNVLSTHLVKGEKCQNVHVGTLTARTETLHGNLPASPMMVVVSTVILMVATSWLSWSECYE